KPYHCLIYLNPQDKMLDLDKQKIKCYVTFKEELISLGNKNYQVIDKGNEHLFIKGSIGTTELFKFKNDFFKTITLKNGIQNWVDIEREYYHQLKEIVKNDSLVEQKYEQVKMLNDELEQIKKLFEKYLDEKVNTSINNKTITDIKEILKVSRWKFNKDLDDYKLEFSKDDYTELEEENAKKKGLFYGEIANQVHDKKINEVTLILNFNYTSLIDTYLNERELSFFEHIQIRGKVNGS